jgi:hypothetical protein
MVYSYQLIQTIPRKNRKGKPIFSFTQTKQITLGKHTKQYKKTKMIQRNKFLCIVPLYDVELVFEIVNDEKNGFDLMSIINIIVDLTIAVYQFDYSLNPSHFNNCDPYSCGQDAAQEYVLSKLYMKKDKANITIWYDADH